MGTIPLLAGKDLLLLFTYAKSKDYILLSGWLHPVRVNTLIKCTIENASLRVKSLVACPPFCLAGLSPSIDPVSLRGHRIIPGYAWHESL
ncbi:MAG: hypothetical protein AUK34_14950 [Ignavibacteria bacterium CG2_30_36_16]|nr:MAG: hypothetical protein AUK34_14950 [Ignavibacteria bacterium CG2_30_36_16]PJB00256.1 MAG: hypothetical protein CO127_08895 [Ignavibacteria bacterium CG_4_9_14_3_um_filter_36_18]